MISMTGYGYAQYADERMSASVEVKSVNNRYLDVNVTLPGMLGPLEPEIRERVAGRSARGRIDVFIRLRELQEDLSVHVDRAALAGYLTALEEVREAAGIDEPVRLSDVLAFDAVLKSERSTDAERYREPLFALVDEALDGFVATRTREGERLAADVDAQLARVEQALADITEHAPQIDAQVRSNLRDRFREVVGDSVEESRLLAEVAVQLTRFSINEELVRLRAHVESFRSTASAGGPVGKKLDFLCQEMGREINTIGSKSIVLAVSERVVEAKDALENVREQLRNVE